MLSKTSKEPILVSVSDYGAMESIAYDGAPVSAMDASMESTLMIKLRYSLEHSMCQYYSGI